VREWPLICQLGWFGLIRLEMVVHLTCHTSTHTHCIVHQHIPDLRNYEKEHGEGGNDLVDLAG
jgi:hypothetical protein